MPLKKSKKGTALLKPTLNSSANFTLKSSSVIQCTSYKKNLHKWTSVLLHKTESPLWPKSKLTLTSTSEGSL